MRIGELAKATGTSSDTLRFYESRGLIRARRSDNGYREFAPETAEVVRYLRLARELGFTLTELAQAAPARNTPRRTERIRAMLISRVDAIDAQIATLTRMRSAIAERIAAGCPLEPADEATS